MRVGRRWEWACHGIRIDFVTETGTHVTIYHRLDNDFSCFYIISHLLLMASFLSSFQFPPAVLCQHLVYFSSSSHCFARAAVIAILLVGTYGMRSGLFSGASVLRHLHWYTGIILFHSRIRFFIVFLVFWYGLYRFVIATGTCWRFTRHTHQFVCVCVFFSLYQCHY